MFLTNDQFKAANLTNSATEITTDMITDCLQNAKDELVNWCGQEAVSFVEDAVDTSDIKVRRFRKAQDKLAMREMLEKMSARFRSGGIKASEKDSNDSSVDVFEKYSETEKRRDNLYNEAKEAVKDYLLPDEEIIDPQTDFINFSATFSKKAVW